MRKFLAVLALGAAAAAVAPVSTALAQTQGHREWRGHYVVISECYRDGALYESSGKADGFVCEVNQLGGADLYMIYN